MPLALQRVHRRGMSLVEVLVATAVLLGLMLVLSIGVFSTVSDSQVDTQRLVDQRQQQRDEIARLRGAHAAEAGPAKPMMRTADLEIALGAEPVADGPTVHTLLDLSVDGSFTFLHTDATASTVRLWFPLPGGAQDVVLTVAGEQVADARFSSSGVEWVGPLEAEALLEVDLAYRTTELDDVTWPLLGARQQRPLDLHAVMTLPEGFEVSVPADALQPTSRTAHELRWTMEGLTAPAQIEVAVPASRTPLGRIAWVCWLAALGLAAFCAGFWYLEEGERPGHLDDFHLGGLLLLALNYASFYVIFAVLGVRIGVAAAPIAAVVSLPLLAVHVARLTSPSFAIRRVMPLAASTMAALLAFVYLDPWRPMVVLGSGVAAMAWVTLTWSAWSSGRRAWASVLQGQRARQARLQTLEVSLEELRVAIDLRTAQLTATRRVVADLPSAGAERAEVGRASQRLERALARARPATTIPEDWELLPELAHRQHCAARQAELDRAWVAVERLGDRLAAATEALERAATRAADELSSALGEMERALDALALVEVEARAVVVAPCFRCELDAGLEQTPALRQEACALSEGVGRLDDLRAPAVAARQVRRRAEGLTDRLRDGMAHPTALPWTEGVDSEGAVHCPRCGGVHLDHSRYCSLCGAERPVELPCTGCGGTNRLPRHLLREDWPDHGLHCGMCGGELHHVRATVAREDGVETPGHSSIPTGGHHDTTSQSSTT
jgi:type II secretory pathway pseudopilin PulG